MKTVLVTGASGFVGGHVVEALARNGLRPRCLVRRTSRLDYIRDFSPELVFGDITSPASLDAAVEGADCIVHCAGVIHGTRRQHGRAEMFRGHTGFRRRGVCSWHDDNHVQRRSNMILNARDKITRRLLSLATTPLLFYPYYRHHLPMPSVILIENTNCCNAHCVMCPRETLTRKRGFMEFGLFERIIKEVSNARRTPVVHLHGFGESLLDESLSERIVFAKACGIKQTYLVTNASLLFPETSRKIILAGLDTMKISFYGTDEESYHATMRGLDFRVALHNIREFVRIRKELKKRTPKLILQYLPQEANEARTEEFLSMWRTVLDKRAGDCLNRSSLHNYGGGRAYNRVGERIVSVCFYPWSALSVLWDGRTVTCCMDYDGVQGVGDLNFQSVTEIWNGPVLSAIRRNFGKLDYSGFPTCLCCDWVRRR